MDNNGEDIEHLHSVIVKIGGHGADFDIDGLLDTLEETSMEVLRSNLEAKYTLWTYMTMENAYWKINSIYQTLSRYASRVEPTLAPQLVRQPARSGGESTPVSQSKKQGSQSHARSTVAAHVDPRKRNIESPYASKPCQKRRKGAGEVASSCSALTHVDRRLERNEDAIPDFEKFAKAQNDFWKDCEGCYLFDQQTHTIDIAQCILAKDEFIIRKL